MNTFEDVVIVFFSVALALTFLWFLRRCWPFSQRRDHNDIIGWQVSVLGTTYAVIVGFMLFAVWNEFNAAKTNADQEANSVVNVFRLADGLPAPQRDEIQKLARDYVNAMLVDEWPAMHEGRLSLAAHRIVQQLWTTSIKTQPTSLSEQTNLDHLMSELTTMTQYRRLRELQSQSKLPGILWTVLIVGGVITTLSSCLFGTDSFKLHFVQVFLLSLLLSLALVTIADIDRPFRGSVHVPPAPFVRARDTLANSDAGF
ncbi:MAG: hypothetical protein WA192_12970 [Candidatus Acidiferrales bacterium]